MKWKQFLVRMVAPALADWSLPLPFLLAVTAWWGYIVWLALNGKKDPSLATLIALVWDLWIIGNWAVLIRRGFKRRRKHADWSTSPDNLHRALRDTGFSEPACKAIGAKLDARRVTGTITSGTSAKSGALLTAAWWRSRIPRRRARPRVAGPLLGVKVLNLRQGYLYSPLGGAVWPKEGLLAMCRAPNENQEHPADTIPDADCTCGIYAYDIDNGDSARHYLSSSSFFTGRPVLPGVQEIIPRDAVVLLEALGRVQQHSSGWRAAHAVVVAVLTNPEGGPYWQAGLGKEFHLLQENYPAAIIDCRGEEQEG